MERTQRHCTLEVSTSVSMNHEQSNTHAFCCTAEESRVAQRALLRLQIDSSDGKEYTEKHCHVNQVCKTNMTKFGMRISKQHQVDRCI